MGNRFNQALRGLTALAASAALLFAGATAATAAEVGPDQPNHPTSGSLTVHKYEQPAGDTGLPNDGQELSPEQLADLTPLADVTFSVQKVEGIDLTQPSEWSKVETLIGQQPITEQKVIDAGFTLGAPVEQTTGADGVATFDNLDLGVYLVTETASPDNVAKAAAPFLVSIPMAQGQNENGTDYTNWLYDIHAYPKNSVSQVTKDVDTTAADSIGDVIKWPVTSTAPTLAADDEFKGYSIIDTFDDRLTFDSVEAVSYAGQDLAEGDYTVTQDGQTVTVALTEQGLAKVKADSGKEFKVTFVTTVTELGDGTIKNTVTQYTNVNDNEKEITSNEVKTYFGAVKITKTDAENAQLLQGAKFQVFATAEDAAARQNPIDVNGETTFTTDANGVAVIEALKAGELRADGTDTTSTTYYLVEVEAPAGYVLDDQVREVTVTAGSVTQAEGIDITNAKQPPFQLPLTGGVGTALFIGAGAALVAVAIGLAARNRKREQANA